MPSGEQPVGELGVQYGGGSETFSYLLNLNLLKRAENKGDESKKYKGDGSLNEIKSKTDNSDVIDLTLAPRFIWQTDAGKFSLDPFYARTKEDKSKAEYKFKPDGTANGSKLEEEDKVNEIMRLRLGWERKLSDAFTLNLRGTAQQASEDTDKNSLDFKPDGSLNKTNAEDKLNEETEYSIALEVSGQASDLHSVKLGLEWQDTLSEADKTAYENGTPKATDAKGIFSIDEQRWTLYGSDEWMLSEKHLLTTGLRLEDYETDARQSGGTVNSSSDVQVNPSLHYRYQWTDETVLRAGVARTLRLAKLDQLNPFLTINDGTITNPDAGGNPDLEPETAIGYDVGVEHYFTGENGVAGANVFYRDISDLIEPVTMLEDARYVSRHENVGDAKLWGVELDISRRLDFAGLPNLTLWGNYTWLDSEVRASDGTVRTMKDLPDYIYNIGFDQAIPGWGISFGAAVNVLGPIDSESPKGSLTEEKTESSKTLVDIYAHKDFAENWRLSLTAYNIFKDDKSSEKRIINQDGSLKESESKLESSARTIMITLAKRF
jgi:iron complex outermembrane receptor protein